MRLTKFTIISISVLLILILANMIFAVLTIRQGLHVNKVTLTGSTENANIESQKIEVSFNRPLADNISKEQIEISPLSEFQSYQSGSKLIIIFRKNLQANTEYEVQLKADIQDIYGHTLEQGYNFSFRTEELQLLFLHPQTDSSDQILVTNTDWREPQVIYEAQSIISYHKKDNNLAVITDRGDNTYTLKLFDTTSQAEQDLVATNYDVQQVQFSKQANLLYYLAQAVHFESGFLVPDSGRQLFVYNLENQQTQVVDTGDKVLDIQQFILAPDGRTLIIQDAFDSVYYLLDLNNPENFTVLGRYVGSGGFNKDADQIVFTNFDFADTSGFPYIDIFNDQREKTNLVGKDLYSIDPTYSPVTNVVAFSQKYQNLPNARGFFQLILMSSTGGLVDAISQADTSLELPQFSPDGNYIALEGYNADQLQDFVNVRSFGFQTKPANAFVIIYDVKNKQLINTGLQGIEIQWD